MEYRVTVTMSGIGRPEVAEKNVERVFRGFKETHPEVEAIVSTNGANGTLAVSFAVEADNMDDAFAAGNPIYADGMTASDLEPDELTVVRVEVELVPVEELTKARELQPA